MRNRTVFFILTFLIIALTQPFQSASAVSAAAPPTGLPSSGLTVSPAYSTAQVGSKQPQTSISIGVKNNSAALVSIEAALKGLAVQGSSLIPGTDSEDALSKIISITPNKATIPAGGSVNIIVNVTDDVALSPGGHYASILISQVAGGAALPQNQLSIEPAISATVYVIKEDGAVRSLTATAPKPGSGLLRLPQAALMSFANTGNVTTVPRGVVTIRQGDKIYAQGVVNTGSLPVFRNTSTNFSAELKPLKRAYMPGIYTASLEYRYDGQNVSQTVSNTFLHVPAVAIMVVVIDLLLAILLYRWWHKRPKKRVKKVFQETQTEGIKTAEKTQYTDPNSNKKVPDTDALKSPKKASKKRRVIIDID